MHRSRRRLPATAAIFGLATLLDLSLLLAAPASAHAEGGCEPLQGPIEGIEQQVILGDLDPIPALVERAEAAVACAELLPPPQLARLFRAEGAWLTRLGAAEEATLAFASAARLAPGRWSPALPAEMEGSFRDASARQGELGTGTLRVEAAGAEGAVIEVNGRPVGPRSDLPAGLHTVLVRGQAGRSGHLIMIYEGEVVVVEPRFTPAPTLAGAPLEPTAPAALPAAPVARSTAPPRRPWLIAAGSAALGATTTAILARGQIDRAAGASSAAELQRMQQAQLGLGITSYSLMAGTGALLTVGLTR